MEMTTPTYYPPGWDAERWQSATDEEFDTLTDKQFETFHTGIRAHLGEDGTREFFHEMDRRQAAARAMTAASTSIGTAVEEPTLPIFVRTLDQLRSDDSEYPEWGFVVFRTAGYSDDSLIKDVKERIQAEINKKFDAYGSAEVHSAREKFKLMWIEEDDLDGATPQTVAQRYRDLEPFKYQNVPFGLAHTLCLCVDESSIKSIQQESSGPGPAHMLAVSISCGEEFTGDEAEDERWTGSFKVAVRSLLTELFPDVGNGGLTPFEIGVGVTEELVWITSVSRNRTVKATA